MPAISLLFFASGFSALIYQVLWTRLVTSMIGGSDYAIAIIVTIFMAGLGLGSKFSGWLASRLKQPRRALVLFGCMEIMTGVYALVLPSIAPKTKPVLAYLYAHSMESALLYHAGALVICTMLLIFPVLLMGATLPLLCTAMVNSLEKSRHGVPILYGINTLGAATGALMAGFVLIYRIGVQATTWLAAMINIVIGVSCFVLFRRLPNGETAEVAPRQNQTAGNSEGKNLHFARWALVITFISGFVSLSSEVIWTKMLGLLAGPTTFSFSIVLFNYILCLGLGSLLAVFLIRRDTTLLPTLLAVQVIIGVSIVAVSQLLGNSSLLFAKLAYTFQGSPLSLEISKLWTVLLLFAVPVTLMGASLPIAFRLYSLHDQKIGRSIGNVYAINTLGSVLGAGWTGFFLIPLIGMETTLSSVALLQIGVAFAIALWLGRPVWIRIVLLVVFSALASYAFRYPQWNKTHLAEGKYHRFESLGIPLSGVSFWEALWSGHELIERRIGGTKLLYYGEGIGGFTTVMEEMDILGNQRRFMANSGKVDASSHGDIYTQAMLGHLPALVHPGATNALVVGFGCGMTSGELLHYPGISVDSVEISPQVIEAAEFFNPWNNDVLNSPRNRTIIQDARAHLLLGNISYDIITAEPSNPWMAGLANLFSREHLDLVKSRLTDDGVFVQFIYSYQTDWNTFSLMMRTISSVFPNCFMIRPAYWKSDYLLVCFKNPDHRLDIDVVRKNLARASASTQLRIEAAEVIYPLIVSENVAELAGPGPLHTDNLPILETWAPRNMFLGGQDIDQKIDEQKVLSDDTQKHLNAFTNQAVQLAFARYLASGNQPPFLVMDPAQTEPALWAEFMAEIRAFAAANPVFDFQTVPDDLVGEVAGVQEPLIRAALIDLAVGEFMDRFRASSCHAALASMYQRAGRMDDVAASYTRMVMLNPEDDALKGNLAMLYYQKGQIADTLELLAMMNGERDWRHTLIKSHGLVLLGRTAQASKEVLASLTNDPQKELYDRYIEFLRGADQGEAADQFIADWEQVVLHMNR